jgi:putative membrane protein
MSSEAAEHRLHPFGIVLIAARRVRRWFGILLPALAGVGVAGGGGVVGAGAGAAAAAGLVFGFLQWRAFTFAVEGDAFVVHRGVLERETRTVPLTRVQSVDVEQGIVDRLVSSRQLTIRTAAGAANVELPAVSAAAEAQLRRALGEAGTATRSEDVVRALHPRELPLIALTSPRALGGVAILLAVANRIDDLAPGNLVVNVEGEIAPHTAVAVLALVGGLALFTVVASLIGTTIALYRFRIVRDEGRLRLRRGLLNFRETVIPVERARAVEIQEGLLREPLHRCTLSVRTAGRGRRGGGAALLFPLLRIEESAPLVREVLPALDPDGVPLERPPSRARGRAVRRASLLPLAGAAGATLVWWPAGAVALVVVPPFALLGLARFRAAGLGIVPGRLRWRRREVARRTLVAQARSVQWRRVRQSPFQRRRSLATLEVGLAVGGIQVRVRDLDADQAGRLARALDPRSHRAEPSTPAP